MCRKSLANVEAVTERQELDSLSRDEKTQARALAALSDKMDQLRAQRDKLQEDAENLTKQRGDVSLLIA